MPYDKYGKEIPFPKVTRDEWGAAARLMPWKSTIYRTEPPVESVIIRFTGTDACLDTETCKQTCRDIQAQQMGPPKEEQDITFSFLIGGDGNVYEGLGYLHTTVKTEKELIKYDFMNVDIAYIGRTTADVTQEMRDLVKKVIQYGIKRTYITPKFVFLGDHEAVKELKASGK